MQWKSPEDRVKRAKEDYLSTIDRAKPFFDFLRFLITSGAIAALTLIALRDAVGQKSWLSGVTALLSFFFFLICLNHLFEIVWWWSLYHTVKLSIRFKTYESIQSGKLGFKANLFIWIEIFAIFSFLILLGILIVKLIPPSLIGR
jgi:hypothetical protein